MDINEKKARHHKKRTEILTAMSKYKDDHGNVDMTKFRENAPELYSKIPYYFNSVEGALQALGTGAVEENMAKGSPTNKLTLRNSLCYDMLFALRQKHTFEEIGDIYGVSRAHVRQLLESLESSVGAKRKEEPLIVSYEVTMKKNITNKV